MVTGVLIIERTYPRNSKLLPVASRMGEGTSSSDDDDAGSTTSGAIGLGARFKLKTVILLFFSRYTSFRAFYSCFLSIINNLTPSRDSL